MTKIISGTLTISRDLRKSDQILEKYLKSLAKNDYRITSIKQYYIDKQKEKTETIYVDIEKLIIERAGEKK